jgi:NAD-reducing hydrogenase small subunit
MSLLDLDERIVGLLGRVDLVFSPLTDTRKFPKGVDIALVEGAVCNEDNLRLARELREKSKLVVAFGDCAVTGNVPGLRNRLKIDEIVSAVYPEPFYGECQGPAPGIGDEAVPGLLPRVVPLDQVIQVDVYLPGCPPDPERIWTALDALLSERPVELPIEMRTFG